MSKEIAFEIVLDGKSIPHCNSIVIHQAFNAHHTFELVLDQDTLGKLASHDLYDYQDYVGRDLYVGFGERNTDDNAFQGIVTEVGLQQQEGAWGKLVLKGKSLTCLLDAGADYISYEKMKLSDIVNYCKDYTTTANISIKCNPNHTDEIGYMCQYGESGFDFMNRLSAEYGEWFFYDGKDICFGRPKKQKNIELVYGSNLSEMNYAMRVLPANAQHYSYKSVDDEVIMSPLPSSVDGASSLTQTALKRSNELYAKPVKQPATIRISDKSELDAHVKVQKGKIAASSMLLTATGDSPKVLIGNFVTIKLSKKTGTGFEDHGEYLVTKVSHYLTGTGAYKNTFEGIPSANEIIPFSAAKPVAQTQMAVVTDNNDPKDMGRVRVQMLWQQDTDQKTDWIRVMTPDAGGGGDVKKNRGQVFIPEVGDQVMVAFRYNDPSRPFILGSLFHGTIAGGGGKQNEVKSMTTKAGSTLIFNDKEHSVKMQTSNGNTVHVNEKSGAITISSGSSVTINSKNITLNGSESISLQSPSITIGSLGGEHPTETVDVKGKAVTVEGEKTVDIKSKEIKITGEKKLSSSAEKMDMDAKDSMTLKAGSKIKASSGDSEFI